MKKLFLSTLILVSFNLASANNPTPTTSTQQEIKVGVKGMVCAFCAQGIEKNFLKQPEVSKIEVSLENKYVKLKFKEGQSLSQEKIATILKDAGYESVFGQ